MNLFWKKKNIPFHCKIFLFNEKFTQFTLLLRLFLLRINFEKV